APSQAFKLGSGETSGATKEAGAPETRLRVLEHVLGPPAPNSPPRLDPRAPLGWYPTTFCREATGGRGSVLIHSVEHRGCVRDKTDHPEAPQCDKHDEHEKVLVEPRVPHVCLAVGAP